MLNSHNFELDASRNKVTNIDSDVSQNILESFSNWFLETIAPTYLQRYRDMSSSEKKKTESVKKVKQMEQIREDYPGELIDLGEPISGLVHEPTTEYTTAILLGMMVESGKFEGKLGEISKIAQHVDKSTDMIALNSEGQPILVEIEHRLSSLFKHKHPVDSYDVIVVWDRQNFTAGDTWQAPWGDQGNITVSLKNLDGQWSLKWGGNVSRPLFVLQDLIRDYPNSQD